jgi:hypothetical protein
LLRLAQPQLPSVFVLSPCCGGLTFWHRNLAFKFEHTLYVKCE